MSVAKVTEITSSSDKSFEDANRERDLACQQDVGRHHRSMGPGHEGRCPRRKDLDLPR